MSEATVDITSRVNKDMDTYLRSGTLYARCSPSTSKEATGMSHLEGECEISINNKKMENNHTSLLDGDASQPGPSGINNKFHMSTDSIAPPSKKPRLNENSEQRIRVPTKGMRKLVYGGSTVTDFNTNQSEISKVWKWLITNAKNNSQNEHTEEMKLETKYEEMKLNEQFFSPEIHLSTKEQKENVKGDKAHQSKEEKGKVKRDKSIRESKGKVKGNKVQQSTKEQKGKAKTDKVQQLPKEKKEKVKEDKTELKKKYNKAGQIKQLQASRTEEMQLYNSRKFVRDNKNLERKLREMQKLLEKKEQRVTDLERQDAKNKAVIEALKKEFAAKEAAIRSEFEGEIKKRRSEKEKMMSSIKYKQLKEDEYIKKIEQLSDELNKVKAELANTEVKIKSVIKEMKNAAEEKEKQLTEFIITAQRDIMRNIEKLIESELQCIICNELFVKPITLNCAHTFCHLCISNWKTQKPDCPMCRAPITAEIRSVVLDTFIDKAVQNLSKNLQSRRQAIVEERPVPEPVTENRASTSNQRGFGTSARRSHPILTISDSSSESDIEDSSLSDDSLSTSSSYEHCFGEYGFCLGCD